MKFISRTIHGVLDYMSGLLLIASPWIFNFQDVPAARWVAIAMGAVIIIMSLNTDYEAGLTKLMTMSSHLRMDIVGGIFLAASPWIFGFSDLVYLPHLILGLMEMAAGVFTEQRSEHPNARHIDDLRHAR